MAGTKVIEKTNQTKNQPYNKANSHPMKLFWEWAWSLLPCLDIPDSYPFLQELFADSEYLCFYQ